MTVSSSADSLFVSSSIVKMKKDGTTTTDIDNVAKEKDDRALLSLALPWAVLAAAAVISAVIVVTSYQTPDQQDDEDYDLSSLEWNSNSNNNGRRDLYENDEQQYLQTGVYPTQQHEHHHHKPVYNEEHEPLFPLTTSDYWGFLLATAGLMIAAGGGIGGGGILVPIYILVMGFSPKHAIPLSNITVFGGAVANTVLNAAKRHPLADRPLVDWDLILVMEPLTIGGALIGAFLNKVLPELLLTVMLVALLSYTAYNSLKKGFKMYRKETAAMKAAGIRQDGTRESELTRMAEQEEGGGRGGNDDKQASERLLDKTDKDDKDEDEDEDKAEEDTDGTDYAPLKEVELDSKLKEERDTILEEERTTPKNTILVLSVLFVVVLAINLLKGGGAFPSPLGIQCGSTSFWIANAIMLGWILLISFFVRMYLVQRCERKERCRYPYVEGDIKWDGRATIVYPCICCLAGFFAGMFGVGGGIVKGPLMLAMGVHPAVSSASSACMILFTSFTATTSFVVFGLLVEDYAAVCLTVGFVATLAGQVGLSYLMRRNQRNSYIVFSIGAVVLMSAFLMTIQSLLSMAEGEQHHAGGICGKGD